MKIIFVDMSKEAFFCLYNAQRAELGFRPIPAEDRDRVWSHMRKNMVIGKDSLITDLSEHDLQLLRSSGHPYKIIQTTYIKGV